MRRLVSFARGSGFRVYVCTMALSSVLFCVACGGGGSSTSSPPPSPEDFVLTVNPATLTIAPGGSATTSLNATGSNGFASQVSVQITGLPAGLTASPQSTSLTPGTPANITFSALTGMAATTATATLTGTSSALQHTATLAISVSAGSVGNKFTRTKYVRTDGVTEYFASLNTHWTVYNSPTSRFFVTDPSYNRVTVLDAVTQTVVANIEVPGAFGIDDTPDHSTLYVGTLLGDVYSIDPVAMKVKTRYIAGEIGPYGFSSISAQVLADGRVALLGAQGGIPNVDGSTNFAIWNPADNSIVIYGSPSFLPYSGGVPTQPFCPMGNIGGFARSGDRTSLFLGSVDSDGTVCQVVPSTGQLQSVVLGGFGSENLFPSPDGSYLALRGGSDQVIFLDAHTLSQAFVIQAPSGSLNSASSFVYSADSKTFYIPNSGAVTAYDLASQKEIGWLPNMVVIATSGGLNVGPSASPNYEAISSTGLLGGPLEEGFGFLDTTQLRTGPMGTSFSNAYLNPATGPATGGTTTQWSAPATVNARSQIYFGPNPATSLTNSGGYVSVTTPAGNPGPVDVYAFTQDGGMDLIPDAFSYGPTILEVTTNYSTAEGGGQGAIYGYGFGPATASTSVPSGLSVSVGGQPATIVSFNPNAYNISSPPFLLQSFYFTIPPGTASSAVDVAVTTGAGTTSASGALHYLPALKQFSLPGAALAQGVYDRIRDLYYFTDANKIQVFSRTQGKWLSPIAVTPPVGKTPRLWGIALSPDASKLAVADSGSGVVYLIDPANPASIKRFAVAPSVPSGILVSPAGVAISDSGVIYLTVDVQGGTGFHNFFTLNTNSGVLTDLGIDGPGLGSGDLFLKTMISADNTRVYFDNVGYVFNIDTTTGKVVSGTAEPGCCYGDYELILAPNQLQVEASQYIFDSDMNAESYFVANDREYVDAAYVYGTKFSPDGNLLFQPASQGMDIFDGRVGELLSRIAFSTTLAPTYDALVADGNDSVFIAITGAAADGIAVIDLTSLPEPGPLPFGGNAALRLARSSSKKMQTGVKRMPGTNESARIPRSVPHLTNRTLSPRK